MYSSIFWVSRVFWVYVGAHINPKDSALWSSTGQPSICFCAASRRGSASVLYALLSRNYSSIKTVCWSVPPVLYFLAAARFRFQSPLFLICSNFPVILRFPMNSTRRLQRWFVSKLGPSPVTTAAKPFFSIFSDKTRSVPPQQKIGLFFNGQTFHSRMTLSWNLRNIVSAWIASRAEEHMHVDPIL